MTTITLACSDGATDTVRARVHGVWAAHRAQPGRCEKTAPFQVTHVPTGRDSSLRFKRLVDAEDCARFLAKRTSAGSSATLGGTLSDRALRSISTALNQWVADHPRQKRW